MRPRRKRGWKFFALVGFSGPLLLVCAVMGYYYVVFSRMIDARIHGEMQRVDPRVFARPFELHRGQSLSPAPAGRPPQRSRLFNRPAVEQAGEFAIGRDTIVLVPNDGPLKDKQVRITFGGKKAKDAEPAVIDRIDVIGGASKLSDLTLGAPLITALIPTGREKRRDVPLASIPPHMVNAVLAIEDRRFYEHPGDRSDRHRRAPCPTTCSAGPNTCAAARP